MSVAILFVFFAAFASMLWRSTIVVNRAHASGNNASKAETASGIYFFGLILSAFFLVGTIEFAAL